MSLTLFIFLLALILSFLIPARFTPRVAKSISSLLILFALYLIVFQKDLYVWEEIKLKALKLSFGVDMFSIPLLLAAGILGVLISWNSRKPNFLFVSKLAIIFSSLSLDPLLSLIFMEAASLFLFFYFSNFQEGREAALRFFRFSVASFSLLAVGILMTRNNVSDFWPVVLIFLGLTIKLPLPPFNGWQIQSYSLGKIDGIFLLNGLLTKLPVVSVLRLPFENEFLGAFFSIFTLIAGFMAFRAESLIRKAAYLSSAHLGLVATALFINRESSAQTFFWFCLAHSIASPVLIAICRKEVQSSLEYVYIFLILVGAPLTPGLWADFFIFASIFQKNILWGLVCSAAFLLALATVLQLWPRQYQFQFAKIQFACLASLLTILSMLANLAPTSPTQTAPLQKDHQITSSL